MAARKKYEPGPAAVELRRLRKKAKIGYREMARLTGIAFPQYRHYEERLKEKHLPPDIYAKIKPVLLSHGITIDELRELMHEVMRDELKGIHSRLAEIENLLRGKDTNSTE